LVEHKNVNKCLTFIFIKRIIIAISSYFSAIKGALTNLNLAGFDAQKLNKKIAEMPKMNFVFTLLCMDYVIVLLNMAMLLAHFVSSTASRIA
jgi:hypothetical protein